MKLSDAAVITMITGAFGLLTVIFQRSEFWAILSRWIDSTKGNVPPDDPT